MLVWQDHVGVSELVAWSLQVEDADVLVNLVFIIAEVEVLLARHFTIGVGRQGLSLLLGDLFFEASKGNFFLNQLVDSLLHLGNF